MSADVKPKKVSLFRWKYLIPGLVILVVVWAFLFFLLDPLLKMGLKAGGEYIFGAKVDIARLHTRLAPLSLEIQGIQVADKDKPMTNLFELENVGFALEPVPLFSKKVVIDEMRVTGVRWGTARKTSGALPPGKQKKSAGLLDPNSPTGKLMGKIEDRAKSEVTELPAWDTVQKARAAGPLTVDKMVQLADLKAPQEFEALKTEYQQKAASYDAQIKGLDVNAKINAVGPALQAVGAIKVQTPQDALAAKDTLAKAQQSVQDLQALLGNVQKLQAQAQADFGAAANLPARITEIKDRDLKALSAKFQLPTFSFQNVARVLVGPMWLGQINKVLGYAEIARKYMPAGKPKAKAAPEPAPSRMHGLDVRFPRAGVPPAFLIKTALVSGSTGGPGKPGAPIDFRGLVTDVTSDPVLWGRPTRAKLAGEQGAKAYGLEAELDHTTEVPRESFTLTARGLEASGLNVPPSDYLPTFGHGTVNLTMRFTLAGDQLDTSLEAMLAGLGAPAAQSGSTAQELIKELWTGISSFQVMARLAGAADNLQLSITSNLDKLLGDRLKNMVGAKLAEYQQKLREQIDKLVAGKQSELLNQYGASGQGVLGQLGAQQKAVQDKINEFQKLIKEKQDAVAAPVQQQQQQIQEQGQQQLQNLFKR